MSLVLDDACAQDSQFLALGLDAACVRVWEYPRLLEKLRDGDAVDAAMFELEFMAACTRANVRWEFEPLPRRHGQPNPDFSIELERGPVIVEAEAVFASERIKEEHDWFQILSFGPNYPHEFEPLEGVNMELTPTYYQRQVTDRTYLRANIRDLAARIRAAAKVFLSSDQLFVDVDELVRLTRATPQSSLYFSGAPTDGRAEVLRIVRQNIDHGASQIPPTYHGVVLVDPGVDSPRGQLVAEIRRWLQAPNEGANRPNLIGVWILVRVYWERQRIRALVPVWRDGIPREVVRSRILRRISRAMNWRNARCTIWRQERTSLR